MPLPSDSDPAVLDLLQQAAEWRVLALLFQRPTDQWRGELQRLACELQNPGLVGVAEAAIAQAEVGWYDTTFGPGGPASLREMSYRRRTISAPQIADLAAFYEAFAYVPAIDEPPDHLAVELGFIAYLRLKEAYARFRQNAEQAATTAAAVQRFLAEHVTAVAVSLKHRFEQSDVGYLQQAVTALLARLGDLPQAAASQAAEQPDLADDDDGGCHDACLGEADSSPV